MSSWRIINDDEMEDQMEGYGRRKEQTWNRKTQIQIHWKGEGTGTGTGTPHDADMKTPLHFTFSLSCWQIVRDSLSMSTSSNKEEKIYYNSYEWIETRSLVIVFWISIIRMVNKSFISLSKSYSLRFGYTSEYSLWQIDIGNLFNEGSPCCIMQRFAFG